LSDALGYAIQTGDALAHAQGVKLFDFGIAALTRGLGAADFRWVRPLNSGGGNSRAG
jgi:hypothetical protein